MWPFEKLRWPYWLSSELVLLVCGQPSLIACWIGTSLGHIALPVAVLLTGLVVLADTVILYIYVAELLCPPRIQLTNVAALGNATDDNRRGRLQHLHQKSEIMMDVFVNLARSDLDACQLVSRIWRNTIDENAKELPLDRLDVTLASCGALVWYVATSQRGEVEGTFFNGLRACDRPYFRNAVMSILAYPRRGQPTSCIVETFLHRMSLEDCNLRIWELDCKAYISDFVELFRFTKRDGIPELKLTPRGEQSTCEFVHGAFTEAAEAELRKLTISLEDEWIENCVMADSIGHQLLSELTAPSRRAAAECLILTLPWLGSFQLVRRLVEAFEKGFPPQEMLILCVPDDVSMAQLWPRNLDHFDEASCCWTVSVGRRRLVIQPTEYRGHMNSFMLYIPSQ